MRLLHPDDCGLVAIPTVVIGFVSLYGEPGLAAGMVQTHVLSETQFNHTYERILRMLVLYGFLAAWGLAAVAPNRPTMGCCGAGTFISLWWMDA
jgi:hypothetical protein